jgi:two-component system, chemotaxis family, response regulator WspF
MRIAIVNDLSLARELLRRVVLSVPGFVVAWTAEDGDEAVRKTAADRPDAILMDLVMPRLNGAEATRRIMRESPCPVIVVTATVSGHFDLVYQAMGAGALDAVETPVLAPGGGIAKADRLIDRLKKLDAALHGVTGSGTFPITTATSKSVDLPRIVAIGVSTGGPSALPVVLTALPKSLPAAVIIAQHLDAAFIPGLAERLASCCPLPVRVAQDGDVPKPGVVYVAGTNDHLELSPQLRLRYTVDPKSAPYRPSVDVLFRSLAAHCPRLGVGVLLTGMGSDGAEGLLRMRALGWHTIAQNEATSVVFGMPKAAIDLKAAAEVLPLSQIGMAAVTHLTLGRTS